MLPINRRRPVVLTVYSRQVHSLERLDAHVRSVEFEVANAYSLDSDASTCVETPLKTVQVNNDHGIKIVSFRIPLIKCARTPSITGPTPRVVARCSRPSSRLAKR